MDCRIKSGNDEGKNERKKSEAKRRQTQSSCAAPSGTAAPGSPGAHLSAFHRGSGLGDRTPLPGFSSALPGRRPPSGFPLSLPVSVQRCFSRTGRSAGRAEDPKPPGSGLQIPRAGTALAPHCSLPAAAHRITGRDLRLFVTFSVTIVNIVVTRTVPAIMSKLTKLEYMENLFSGGIRYARRR